jgi:hypothetical protein
VSFCVLFVCKCVLPPGDNPIAVNKYIIIYYLAYLGIFSTVFVLICTLVGLYCFVMDVCVSVCVGLAASVV